MNETHVNCPGCNQLIATRRYPRTSGPYVFFWHRNPEGVLCPHSGKNVIKYVRHLLEGGVVGPK